MKKQNGSKRMNDFSEQGYTIFKGVYDEQTMTAWRREIDRLEEADEGIHAQRRSFWSETCLSALQPSCGPRLLIQRLLALPKASWDR